VLLDAGLVDEWDLTTSSSAVGGDGPRPVAGAGDTEQPFELAQLAIDAESFLFARWRRRAT
jgi:riboflavin biosynthesis pyrimidine reductase